MNLFFDFLHFSLGNKDRFGSSLSTEEWTILFGESKRQAITGILLAGLERLSTEKRPPQPLLLHWIVVGQMIEQRNSLMDKRCAELLRKLTEHDLHGTILKGQGIARLYDKEMHTLRQSGDIDIYVDCELKKSLEFAKSLGNKENEWDYKHLHLHVWDDTEVEMHYRVEVLLNLWKNRKLQRWFKDNNELLFQDNDGLTTPTTLFNVFYILLHIYRHFLYEGVGMRQIIDYYYVLKATNKDNIDACFSIEAVSTFGMERFAKGLMWVMREALGMPCEWMLWEPDSKEGEYILKQIMKGGNFGHYDERLHHGEGKLGAVKAILTHNMHLLAHYPSDVIWAPIWLVWHKCWKLKTKVLLTIR